MSRVTPTGYRLRVAQLEDNEVARTLAEVHHLPPDFWHPCMGPREENKVENEVNEDPRQSPPMMVRLGAAVIALCFLAIVVAGTVRIVQWILGG